MLNYSLYVRNIIEAINKIEKSCRSKRSLNDVDIFDMTLMRLQTIGENSIKIPREIKQKHKEVKWNNVRRLRNVISHKYQTVDKEIVWKFIEEKLPLIKQALEEVTDYDKKK